MKRAISSIAKFLVLAVSASWLTMTGAGGAITQMPPVAHVLFAPSFVPLGDGNQTPVVLDATGSMGENVHFLWRADEGTFVSGTTPLSAHPRVTFPGLAAYTVVLQVTDEQGQISTMAGVIPSATGPPTAGFTFSPARIPPMDGNQTVVRFSSAPSVGEGLRVFWDIPAGTFVNGTGPDSPNPEVTFPGLANYDVTLTVVDQQGRRATASSRVELNRGEPIASFDFNPAFIPPGDGHQTVVTFDARSSQGSGLMFDWDIPAGTFVNGTDAQDPDPQVTFPGQADYSVTLTVTDDQGRTATVRGIVPLDPGPPTAAFTFSPPSVPRGDGFRTIVSFDSSGATGIRLRYLWRIQSARFENGTSPTSALPQVTFPGVRPYSVRLTVTDAAGREAVATGSVPLR